MDALEVSTVVHRPPERVYEFLLDFPGYADYSDHLTRVERVGAGESGGRSDESGGRSGVAEHAGADENGIEEGARPGGPGTEYRLHFQWWKLSYVARSRVTGVDPPRAIDWEITKDVDARGQWLVEPVEGDDGDPSSRIRLVVRYDPDSAHAGILDLPRFVPIERVIAKVTDLIAEEGKRVVERVVADLEGERRAVDLTVEYR